MTDRSSEPLIRRATIDDLPAIVALLADDVLGATREDVRVPLSRAYVDAFRQIDVRPDDYLIVAEIDAAIVGTLQVTVLYGLPHRGARRALIEAVRVASSQRGVGLGALLVGHAIAYARERGCSVVQLTTNKQRIDAHRFYARLGFVASHEGMKLELAPAPGQAARDDALAPRG